MRVRLTTAKRATPEVVMEPAEPGARLGKQVLEVSDEFAEMFLSAQADYWRAVAALEHMRRGA